MIVGTLLTTAAHEFTGAPILSYLAALFTILGLACFTPQVPRTVQLFVAIGIGLVFFAVGSLDDWQGAVLTALSRASFIAAFFTALTAIRSAAITDPSILECGRFLVSQPPGRRYIALTIGSHLFGLLLTYGSISLLGALATDTASRETNPEVRRHRTRRVLIAVQRGFIATLPWSPLAFASAITLSVIPGASWADALPLTIVSGVLLAGIGWGLDTAFKPRLTTPPPKRGPAEGGWFEHMKSLYLLLLLLGLSTAAIHLMTGVRIFGVVMALVPAASVLWIALQHRNRPAPLQNITSRVRAFATSDIPNLKKELTLLTMAGFIGSLGAATLSPLIEGAGINFAAMPTWILVLCVFWFIPVTGQLGMNPILAVSLFAPFLPSPDVLGIEPAILVCAMTSGWALSGVTSPFTASVLLIAAFGKVSPLHVGLRWNGVYALVCGATLSVWLFLLTYI